MPQKVEAAHRTRNTNTAVTCVPYHSTVHDCVLVLVSLIASTLVFSTWPNSHWRIILVQALPLLSHAAGYAATQNAACAKAVHDKTTHDCAYNPHRAIVAIQSLVLTEHRDHQLEQLVSALASLHVRDYQNLVCGYCTTRLHRLLVCAPA